MNTILSSIAIAGVALLGVLAKIVIFIVSLYFLSFIIWEGMNGKSDPNIKNLFKGDTIIFFVVFFFITIIIFLYMSILYG